MSKAGAARTPEGRSVLLNHARSAWREAVRLRFETEEGIRSWQNLTGSPGFCTLIGIAVLTLIAIASGGFHVSRQILKPLPYPDADRVVILAQGPPAFGVRLGFRDQEVRLFRKQSQTLSGIATYSWSESSFQSAEGQRGILEARVSQDFFNVLAVAAPTLASDSFIASFDFFQTALKGDPNQIGKYFEVAGRPLKLGGVLSPGFTFLSAPIAVYTLDFGGLPVPPRQWWLTLRGALARLSSGITPAAAASELRRLKFETRMPGRNFTVYATPIGDIVTREMVSYSWDFLYCLLAAVVWAIVNFIRDRRRGIAWHSATRFWGFFIAKILLILLAVFLSIFEFTDAHIPGITGGQTRGAPFLFWILYAAVVVTFFWAIRDQRMRCRVCMHRLREPLRIGIPGQILLDTAGQVVMCPHGHGSIYTSVSMLGSGMANRWLGLGDIAAPADDSLSAEREIDAADR